MRRPVAPADPLARALRAALDRPQPDDRHPSEAQVAAYLAHDLGNDDVARLEEHVAGCARCADELLAATAVEDDARLAESFAPEVRAAAEAASAAVASRERSGARAAAAGAQRSAAQRAGHAPSAAAARPRRRRSWLRIAAGVTIVFGALAIAAAAGSRAVLQRLEPMMLAGMSNTLGRTVSGGDASLVLAGGPGVRLDDVTIAEDARFGGGTFASARSAALRLDPGALLRGQVRGDVHLDQPTVHLMRDASGVWNVATMSGKRFTSAAAGAARDGASGASGSRAAAGASERAVRLASASVTNGVLEIKDQSGGRDVTLRDVDLAYASGGPTAPARVTLTSVLGSESQRIALRGEIGPFEGGAEPRWRFDEVRLSQVPVADIPGAPADVSGELSFDGTLASSGTALEAVVMNASGDGALGICCGELRERNLTAELVAALTEHTNGDAATTAADVLARARRSPALAAVLGRDATPFEDISGNVTVAQGSVTFDGLAVATPLFQAKAAGSVSRGGALDAHGTVTLTPDATAALVALVPEAQRLFATGGKLEVPFSVAGRWPDVDVRVDVRTAIASLLAPLDPRLLVLGVRLAG